MRSAGYYKKEAGHARTRERTGLYIFMEMPCCCCDAVAEIDARDAQTSEGYYLVTFQDCTRILDPVF